VGPKLSEETYSQDDQLTLNTLANQTAMTIENARLYWELQGTLDALRKAHDELELRVQERTAELAQANEALQGEITERKRAEEQIKTSLREKEILLQEIHHRVKNNLQVISSLLYLQSTSIEDQQSLEILQDSQNRVRTMALVHERLYQSEDLAKISLAEYIRNLANNLFQSYDIHPGAIKLKVNVGEVHLGIDTAIPCGLIVNELVSNCLKHAFPDGRAGEIRIEFWADGDGRYNLIVSDDGVGFPQDIDFRTTSSLGLQLVNNLTTQLRGTIGLDRTGGTAFKIAFTELL
jgi:two-component sensor histidine kinase